MNKNINLHLRRDGLQSFRAVLKNLGAWAKKKLEAPTKFLSESNKDLKNHFYIQVLKEK